MSSPEPTFRFKICFQEKSATLKPNKFVPKFVSKWNSLRSTQVQRFKVLRDEEPLARKIVTLMCSNGKSINDEVC
jgi:hypothetical protein